MEEGGLPVPLEHHDATNGRTYWRSLDELAGSPEFRKHAEVEFPGFLEETFDLPAETTEAMLSRRSFLGVLSASVALAGLAGCQRPLAKILPYTKLPEDLLPGVPQAYATVMTFRGMGEGILVTSNEGRPTKVEGNPDHPASLGATHSFAQASILQLYDPDRSQIPTEGNASRTWDEFTTWLSPKLTALRADGGRGLAFLSLPTASPALRAKRAEVLAAFPNARWFDYEPVHRDNVLGGSRIVYGRPLRAQLALDQAEVIVSLDSDFLFLEPNSVRHARDFARRRRVASEKDAMNRLYAVETAFSITGSMADHRLRVAPTQVADVAKSLAAVLSGRHNIFLGGPTWSGADISTKAQALVQAMAADLAAHRGRSVVLAGSSQPREVHALAMALNHALGNVGPVVRYTEEPYPAEQTQGIASLARGMETGEVTFLAVLGGNPAYDAPADLAFIDRMRKVPDVVCLGLYHDETSEKASWHLPAAHFLEAWGDAEAWDGTRSIQQPLIAPLYQGKCELELLSLFLGRSADSHALVQEHYGTEWGLFSETRWDRALNDGLLSGTAFPEVVAGPDMSGVAQAWVGRETAPTPSRDALQVLFRPDYSVWDGRFSNNAWMQELPDPMTKIVWDNAALVSKKTAEGLGVKDGDLISVTVNGRGLDIAACIVPGLADGAIVLPLGYGRTAAGRVGNGHGFNTYALRASGAMDIAPASVQRAGGHYRLVRTQDHQAVEGRPLVREGTMDEYRKNPEFTKEMNEVPPPITLYTNKEYDYTKGPQWGMTIDLNTCIGCNACAIACQSENNIATVGKDQVYRNREMHWIRIDRYYMGDVEDAEAVHQPIPCMQCENAPCEGVCPVNATNHSSEGLNQMVYNRCIGTRYCLNNCPYKVRRFNFLAWRKHQPEVVKMAMNPDVTVRMRGIMEKCTYCIQRINRKKIDAKNAEREVRDGEIVTACQQVCPTESIVFGDIRDPQSRVSKLKAQNRNYTLLEELNTQPRTSYLARLRNPNSELEKA
jgi:MoCo/4Fe-4S cofactor protein with predicted Tat translocation signal